MKLVIPVRRRGALGAVLTMLWCCGGCTVNSLSENGLPDLSVETGRIQGARFRVIMPAAWSGDLLVVAHGWRPPHHRLSAKIDATDPFIGEVLRRGWMVATTSYRRNGLIIDDARDDLNRLLDAIVRKYGPCRRIIIEGSSMGANIGLLMAEQQPLPDPRARVAFAISGVIALGAAPEAAGENGPLTWSHAPRLPLLFVSNRSELEPVRSYVRSARRARPHPALWVLERDGHLNLNAAERRDAWSAMAAWIAGGHRPAGDAERPHDATVVLEPPRAKAGRTKRGCWGRIVAIDPVYGNLSTDLVEEDLRRLRWDPGAVIRVTCRNHEAQASWGLTYADVEAGELVIFVDAYGTLQLAVNQGHAARLFGCEVGDTIELSKPDPGVIRD